MIVAYVDGCDEEVRTSLQWIPVEDCEVKGEPLIFPLKSMKSRNMKVQLFVEEQDPEQRKLNAELLQETKSQQEKEDIRSDSEEDEEDEYEMEDDD
jgi:hypothetical protein